MRSPPSGRSIVFRWRRDYTVDWQAIDTRLDSRDHKGPLKKAMRGLTFRERMIIKMRFFEHRTRLETAKQFKVTQGRIHHIEQRALAKLRYSMKEQP